MAAPRTVACPRCGALVEWSPASPCRPFCSERCKMIDMGAWATEKYRVPEPDPSPDDPQKDEPGANP